MTKRIGILTSGGDCPGLNAAIRGVAKAAYERMENVEIIGIMDGFSGLIGGQYRLMKQEEFSGILTLGGTILGTVRTPFKDMRKIGDDKVDKVANMVRNYEMMKLDCLCTLGGNGTHKTANLLSEEGLNVIGLPKTIDNDIWGTDVTFGFHTAVDIGTDVIDRVHTTAASHGRVMIVEIMGNKAGWLTLYTGIAGGADVVLIPEMPYDRGAVIEAVTKRAERGKAFSIIALAEGAMRSDEAGMKRKEIAKKLAEEGYRSVSDRLAHAIESATGAETRVVVPGHIQRGGSPSAYDRILATQFGVQAAELIYQKKFGYTVAMQKSKLTQNPLKDVAGKTKLVSPTDDMVRIAKNMGLCFGG
ncbi:ATP-dependent 6-phosphofructokinase 3 [Christensenellaceae bacterium]|nr:ATP-dependent 6-phosphofructokinase 3 [Christensenellaceae bacterium]BDF61243.1 ATP-dependent 6-phosphofructokinase 3 [Christensenellaceae bacterium]